MKQYTRKQLKEYARLGLARDLTEVDPDTLPKWYEKIGVSRGIYGMNGGYYSSFYKNVTDAINDLLEPEKARYNTRDIHALKELVEAYTEAGSLEKNDILCKVLSVVTGRKWDWKIIRGCCQSDWNKIFYSVDDWSREALAAFETMYFNTGSEWIIHDEENTPEGPEDVSGYNCYIVADTEEGIRKELAAVAGCAPSDLVIWAFDEFIRVPQYKAV